MRNRLALALALALPVAAACGGGGPTHWKDQPLETIEGKIKDHAYAIQIPKGMVKGDDSYADVYQYKAKRGGELYVFAPSISISWTDKKQTVDEAMKYEKATPTKKEQTADGFVHIAPNGEGKKDDVIIAVQRYVGDGAFECRARVYPMAKDESLTDLIPRVEKMCLSLTAK